VAAHRSTRRLTALRHLGPGWRRLLPSGAASHPALAGFSLLLVALLVGAVLLTGRVHGYGSQESRRQAALAAARQMAVNFTTLDYRHGKADLQRVLDGATGDFKQEFGNGFDQLGQIISRNQAVSQGQVLEAGLVSSDADSARVLVVADSTVSNKATPTGQRRHYRMQLDLRREGGRWLTSNLEFVG
jgi:Mce-associated membrane protein